MSSTGHAAAAPMAAAPGTSRRLLGFRLFNFIAPFLGLLLVIGLFSLNSTVRPYFLTGANFKIIFTQTVVVAIGSLGMTLIIVSGGIDLSVGSLLALPRVVGASALLNGPSLPPAGLLLLSLGAGIGVINGVVIGAFRMMPFIVTLGMMGIARGMAKWLSDSQTVNPPPNRLWNLMASTNPDHFLPLPMGVWITAALAVVIA